MNGPQFFQTGYGKRFFDGQLPQLIKGIEDLGKAVNRACDMIDNDFKLSSVTVDGEKMNDFVRLVTREEIEFHNKMNHGAG
jgi:hypothetical protein